jgi:hypothetical protein
MLKSSNKRKKLIDHRLCSGYLQAVGDKSTENKRQIVMWVFGIVKDVME